MDDFEKLGAFYLGKPYDLGTKQRGQGILLYDSKDLVTHSVCVGMTGSGKTGLCIDLLEEAAIDGIPAIVIDPKGDLGNLLLTFPELRSEDFLPWVNLEDAARNGLSIEAFAAQRAELWRRGLAEWGQDGTRIKRLRDAAEFRIYTPGSNAGFPVSILNSFSAPAASIVEDPEMLNERISTTVSSLLGLMGIEKDPLRSREHILLSNILNDAWSKGTDLDLGKLIQQIQTPSMQRVGVMDLESFFPAKERFELSMSLNNLLAAPGFASWLEGAPLDIQEILYTAQGKPRVAIFSIAHLNDAERMFFVSLLLNQTVGWMRSQPGTTSLRAILYMDEIFGYFPPVGNPPSKQPLLTLLKQGRAFGLGVVLVTQNPVDLDYKGLSNTGTWFIGRLQTERDKNRVMEGLEGIAATSGHQFDREAMEQTIAGLGNRIFLLNNVHDDQDVIFESRWAMSYLAGPLTRTQIKTLTEPLKHQTQSAETTPASPTAVLSAPQKTARPVLPPEVPQFFIPPRGDHKQSLHYEPQLIAMADVKLTSKEIDTNQAVSFISPFNDGADGVDWDEATTVNLDISDFEKDPAGEASFGTVPESASNPKNYQRWQKDFVNWLYRNWRMDVFHSPAADLTAKAGESERDFRVRLQFAAREERDRALDKLRQKYAPKLAALEDRRLRAQQAIARESEQASSQKMQTAISFGATLLSSFMGRKAISLTTLGRATTAARGVGRSMKEAQDVSRAQETLQSVQEKLTALSEEFKEETAKLERTFDPQLMELETITLKPTKANIAVRLIALVWLPYRQDSMGQLTAAWE